MAVPFRKVSNTRGRKRRTHYKISENGTTKCPKCGAEIRPHRVCLECGTYKGKEVIKKAIGDYMKSLKKLKIEQQQEAELFGLETKAETPDLKGTHIRKTWKARIVDESKVPINYGKMCIREINMSKLNDIAKYTEGKAEIEGVEFYQEETVVVR